MRKMENEDITYTEFELVDFANYVLNHRLMSQQIGDVGHNEFMNWLEVRKPQEFIRKVREYKLDLLFDYEEIKFNDEKTGGYSHLTDSEVKEIEDKLEDRFKNKKNNK